MRTEVSPVTHRTNVTLLKYASINDMQDRASGPHLAARCLDGSVDFYVGFDAYMAEPERDLTFRIDDGVAIHKLLKTDQTRSAAGWWDDAAAKNALKALLGAKRVAMRIEPYGRAPMEAVFNVGDLAQKLPDLAKACAWSLDVDSAVTANERIRAHGSVDTIVQSAAARTDILGAKKLSKKIGAFRYDLVSAERVSDVLVVVTSNSLTLARYYSEYVVDCGAKAYGVARSRDTLKELRASEPYKVGLQLWDPSTDLGKVPAWICDVLVS